MRIALLSDVHGNLITLEAVLKDIEANGGVDGYWVLGDLAALGYDPVGTLERLSKLPGVYVPSFFQVSYAADGKIQKIILLL